MDEEGELGASGRFGGAVQLILAVAGIALLGGLIGHPGSSTPKGIAFALAGVSIIALLGYGGVRSIRQGRAEASSRTKAMSGAMLRELVRGRELGFYVCTRCNTIGDRDWGNGCVRCESVADFLPVTDEDERAMAVSAIVLD